MKQQWHPIFAHLLRPMVEGYYEVRIDQPVGDLPRSSDIILLRKTAQGTPPFQGLWRRLTPWNVLEYKGPTESPRFDALHDLLELGLGIHRRLNELQRKQQLPEMDYPEMSFWYMVNHIGRRFLAEAPTWLPDIQQETDGIWRASLYGHPVLLVSVQELQLEHDSLPLRLLSGVSEGEKRTVVDVLKSEPGLWAPYGSWLALHDPAIWKEILRMATEQKQQVQLDFGPLLDYLEDPQELRRLLETLTPQKTLATMGPEHFWAGLSAEQREDLRRIVQRGDLSDPDPTS